MYVLCLPMVYVLCGMWMRVHVGVCAFGVGM